MIRPVVAAASALVLAAAAAQAHHGWGSYDAQAVFTIQAPVERIQWQNPHVHLYIVHDGAEWEATLAPISRMARRGLSAEMLAPGTEVAVEGYPSTRHPHEMRAERITVAGQTFELR